MQMLLETTKPLSDSSQMSALSHCIMCIQHIMVWWYHFISQKWTIHCQYYPEVFCKQSDPDHHPRVFLICYLSSDKVGGCVSHT